MIYDVVRSVMSALEDQGTTDHNNWDEMVADQLGSLEASYKELRVVKRDLIDYSGLDAQAAYVFRYVIGHAEFISQALSIARAKVGAALFTGEELWVTSVGGGPGSEFLGLLKYLSNEPEETKVKKIVYTVVDKEKNWEHVLDLLIDSIESEIEVKVYFQDFDVTSPKLPEHITMKDEHLVIMSFFISEVCCIPDSNNVCTNVEAILDTMPKGSLLLYNDSKAYSFYSFFNERISSAKKNFEQLIDIDQEFKVKSPDFSGIIDEYIEKFDYRPKLTSNACAKLLRRIK